MTTHLFGRLAAALAALTLAPAALLLSAGPASAAEDASFAILPSDAIQPGQATRPYFILEARPGQSLQDYVTVINKTAKPKSFLIYGADAFNTPQDGAFAVRDYREKQTEVGTWISLPQTSVKVPPKKGVKIPVTFEVPANATPGDHAGAVVAVDMDLSHNTDSGIDIAIQRALGVRTYLRVAGPLTPGLDVESVRVDHEGGQAQIRYTVVNTGNVRLAPTVRARATGMFGRELATFPDLEIQALLPGNRTELTIPWDGVPVLDLATVTVVATDVETGVGDTESTQVFLWRWWLLAIPVVLLLGALAWWLWRRRGNAKPASGAHRATGEREPAAAALPLG